MSETERKRPIRYLTRSELAYRIGVLPDTLNKYKLPEPDAIFGDRKGYLPATVDQWNATRPGRGRWGSRKDPVT